MLIEQTKRYLQEYRNAHPRCKMLMKEAFYAQENAVVDDVEKSRFFRAARQLGLNVMQSRGHYYENGILIW